MDLAHRYSQARFVTLLGSAKNSFLAFIKILFGLLGHSHALVADGIHSLSDLLIDAVVLIASRFGSKAADEDHPYGHGRIETAATVLLAFIMSLAGLGIIIDAGMEVFGMREPTKPNFYILFIALLSVLINEALYFYTRYIGKKVRSKLLLANAAHHRSDSASSLVVFLGVGVAWLGYPLLDPIAAIIVGLMIIRMAWEFGWSSIRELVDTGLEDEELEQIKHCISKIPGVRAIHQLRTRSIAGTIFLDVHVLVDPTISVSEGHFIGHQVHHLLLKEIPNIADVTLHVDPEDDEVAVPPHHLPTRDRLITLLKERWHDLIPAETIEMVILHYLNGKIYLEIKVPLQLLGTDLTGKQLAKRLKDAVSDVPDIAETEVLFGHSTLLKKPNSFKLS